MGRRGGGQAQLHARIGRDLLHKSRVQRAAALAAKDRRVRRHLVGAEPQIGLHRLARDGQDRHDPLFPAFAADAQALAQRQVRAREAQRLGDAQARSVKQRHHGSIARADPALAALIAHRIDHRARGILGQRARQLLLELGRPGGQDRRGLESFALGQETVEGFHRRQLARHGARAGAFGAQMRHVGAHVGGADPRQRGKPLAVAVIARHEGEEAQNIGAIGGLGVLRLSLQGARGLQPGLQRVARLGRDREAHVSQRRMDRSNTPAKKVRRSVPCCGVNWWGSSAPRISRPGRRPSPKSSLRQASERIQSLRSS